MPVLTLAPLAGVGNWVFRLICARLGARMVGVEFINCRTIAENSRRSQRLLDFSDARIYAESGMSLLAAQIYGNDIDLIAQGARRMQEEGAQGAAAEGHFSLNDGQWQEFSVTRMVSLS